MELDLWKVTTIIAGVVLVVTLIGNPLITGSFVSGKPVLELFVMSQCPYGVAAEQLMAPVLNAFGNSIDFRLNFIAAYSNGVFQSLHGEEEVLEDLRQVCAMKYYPQAYYNYVLCLSLNYTTPGDVWESCALATGLDVSVIRNCYEGAEGESLLVNNIKRASELGVRGSETFVLDGETMERSYRWSPDAMKDLICAKYPGLSACSLSLSLGSSGSVSGSC